MLNIIQEQSSHESDIIIYT